MDDHYLIMDKVGSESAVKILASDLFSDATGNYAGGNIATRTNGSASAGQKVVTVENTTGFLETAHVVYTLTTGVIEYNQIDSVDSPTQITLTTNIGTGGIASGVYVGMISPSEAAAASHVNVGNGVNRTLDVAMAAALGNVFNVEAFGARTAASAATNNAAIQAALNEAGAANGGKILLPSKYAMTQLVMPKNTAGGVIGLGDGCNIIMQGNGVTSWLYSETDAPMIVWQDNGSARTSFYNLFFHNNTTGANAVCMKYASSNLDVYRLWLTIRDCTFESWGPTYSTGGDPLAFFTLDFTGLLGSLIDNCYFMGNSRIGGGSTGGYSIRIKTSSNSEISNIYMGCGSRACAATGMMIEGGGNLTLRTIRLDTGSRGGEAPGRQPAFWFKNTKLSTITGLRGEGKDSDPWLLLEQCYDLTFYDIDTGGMSTDAGNVIEIEGGANNVFYGGKIEKNSEVGWTGKCIKIWPGTYRTSFIGTNIVTAGSAASEIEDNGTLSLFELLDGNASSYFGNPPTGTRLLGTRLVPNLIIGENGSPIANVLFGYKSWNVESLVDGATATTTVNVANSIQSDVVIGISLNTITTGNWNLRGYMSADGVATVYITNNTGGTVDLGDGTIRVVLARFNTG